ncbi:MAG: hypothetical protein HY746_00485 [Elusimicrobia bacterium]|nr:hypothetical protein [Elusimicrobiota bacterium]
MTPYYTIPMNEWRHFVAVYNSSAQTFSLYVDGSLLGSPTTGVPPPITNSNSLIIGRHYSQSGSGWFLKGMIDEAGIYNRALTEQEIKEQYTGILKELTDGEYEFRYYSQDNVGNIEPAKTKTLVLDNVAPSSATLAGQADEFGNVILTWTAPGNNQNTGKAAKYDIRTATTPITDENIFTSAAEIPNLPVPRTAGSTETFIVSGLAGGTTHYFALKTADEAGNLSEISNSPGIYLK